MTVNDVIHTLEDIFRQLAGQKLLIITRLDPEAGTVVLAPDALRGLLHELVFKAGESMRHGGTLCIATARVELRGAQFRDWPGAPSGNYVMTSISASAYESEGMSAEMRPKIDTSNALETVRSRGGQLKVTTEDDRSTTIRILLPESGRAHASPVVEPSKSRSDRASETILLVGRDPEVRNYLRALLVQHGYAVLEAANAKHAEIICAQVGSSIDVILVHSDTANPNARVLDWAELLPDVPVVTLHVRPDMGIRDAPAGTGVYPFRIPCTSERLLDKIRVVLEASRSRKAILVVDDDESMRRLVAESLATAGYEVSEAANGKEALRSLATRKAQLVLTEIVMPEADGLQLIQQLRESDPEVRIIAMSGASRAETYLSVARMLGARAALQKPLPPEELLQTVRHVLHAP